MSKQIVVLGASYGGLQSAHYILKHVIPKLPEPASYHLTLVDQGAKWFARVGAPRGVVSEKELPIDKFFLPYEAGFTKYSKEQFTFQQATVTGLDTTARNVSVQLPDGSTKSLEYHALVIATGASPVTPILGMTGSDQASIDAIKEFREAVGTAKTIVIAGGGPAGIETAGELGEFLNGKAGWFSARPKTVKTAITVVSAEQKILPILRPALGDNAEKMLNKRGVDVIRGVKVVSVEPENAGRTGAVTSKATVTLSNGETKEADLYIPAIGTRPNSSWVPAELLDERGLVKTNGKTLRVDAAGPRVFAVGDVSNAGRGGAFELMATVPIAATNLKRDLLLAATPEKEDGAKAVAGKDVEWERKDMESQLVPIGHGGGVGAVFGYKIPSFLTWLIKGRDYMSSMFPKTLNGESVSSEKKFKQ